MNLGKDGVQNELKKHGSRRQKRKSRSIFATVSMFFIGLLLCVCLVASIGIGMISGIIDDAPRITDKDIIPNEQMSMIYDANGNLMETLVQAGSHRKNVKDYKSVPEDLINAFVAVEDSRFWEHNGIDLKGIVRAGIKGITSGFRFSEGASTITQQLIKNNVFTDWVSENSLGDRLERKIQEQYLALQLEEELTAEKGKENAKEEILLSYLNTINLGSNTLGIAIASERYFGKDYSDLTLSECAVLAAITNNPTSYNPITNPEKNRTRVEKILADMVEQGYITEEEEAEALKDDVYARIQVQNETYTAEKDSPNSYFTDAVIQQVAEDLQKDRGYTQAQANHLLYSGGLRIYTTMEPAIQNIIDEEVNDESHYPDSLKQYSCTFTLEVSYGDGTSKTFTENNLKQYFRSNEPDFKLIGDSKDDLMDYIEEFAASETDESAGDTWELTSINYTLQPQVSFVIMDQSTGYVLGISGGRGEKTTDLALNRATNTTRQPGSLFKVLAGFTPALDTCGDTLATVYYDGPYSVGEKDFSNYWKSGYVGYSSIRQSIVYSMNIVSVKCLNETVTPALAFEYLEKYGFTTLVESRTDSNGKTYSDINASLSLGGLTDGVTNLETTAAFATIANGGTYTEPVFYTRILDSDGNVIIDNTPETHTVMKESTAWLLTDAMEEVMDGKRYPSGNGVYLTGTGKRADVDGMSIAGKTGTTSSTNDIWFAGFSPYYTASLWSGYDELQKIEEDGYHKDIWKAIMTRVHDNLPDPGFKAPSGIVSKQICRKSGKLAVSGICDHDPRGSMIYTEYFAEGTEPTEICDKHVSVSICSSSGLRATDKCPSKRSKIFMSLDSTATGYSDDSNYAIGNLGTCKINHVAESIAASRSAEESQKESIKAEEESRKAEESKNNGDGGNKKPDNEEGGASDKEPENSGDHGEEEEPEEDEPEEDD